MPQREPIIPTINELHERHPLTIRAEAEVSMMRSRVNKLLGGQASELLVIVGPCAMTTDSGIINRENAAIGRLDESSLPITALHRIPPWKPRTNPDDWHGLGTSDPEAAFVTIRNLAEANANVAIELGHSGHLPRYGNMVSLGWIGARNDNNDQLFHDAAIHDQSLPLAVKNGLDGTVDTAFDRIAQIRDLRGDSEDIGAAALLFRGGSQFDKPRLWERQLLNVMERAHENDISVIVDVAHGSEMAHHSSGRFEKSVEGQIICLQHLAQIALREGVTPQGIMIEASDAVSPTDPVIPFGQAIDLAAGVGHIRQSQRPYRVNV